MILDSSSVVVASTEQMTSAINDEIVILGLTAGRYFGVEAIGAHIWRLVQAPVTVESIRVAIVTEYDVDPKRCHDDIVDFLRKLIGAGLVEVRAARDGGHEAGAEV